MPVFPPRVKLSWEQGIIFSSTFDVIKLEKILSKHVSSRSLLLIFGMCNYLTPESNRRSQEFIENKAR